MHVLQVASGILSLPTPLVYRYGLADNEDNIPDIIKVGALQRLVDCGEKLSVQASKVSHVKLHLSARSYHLAGSSCQVLFLCKQWLKSCKQRNYAQVP